jgi:hypothetical protein
MRMVYCYYTTTTTTTTTAGIVGGGCCGDNCAIDTAVVFPSTETKVTKS